MPKRKIKPYKIEDGVTQSLLGSWVHCRQLAKYILEGWEKPVSKEALTFGSLWHWLLEMGYSDMMSMPKPKFQTLLKIWMKKTGNQLPPEEAERHLAKAEYLWEPYWAYWKKKDAKINWIGLESLFDIEWEGFRLRGKRDGLFQFGKKKGKWILENKTASRMSEDVLIETLGFDFQNLMYVMSTEEELEEKIKGVLYNVVKLSELRLKKNESQEEYIVRVEADVKSRPEFHFHRFEAIYTEEVKEAFKLELDEKLCGFKAWLDDGMNPTYKNQMACVGRWNCTFLPACSSRSMAGFTQTAKLFSELE